MWSGYLHLCAGSYNMIKGNQFRQMASGGLLKRSSGPWMGMLLFILSTAVFAREAAPPEQPSSKNTDAPSKTKGEQKAKHPKQRFRVQITMGDGRKANGKIIFRAPDTFVVEHTRDKIQYSKKISLEQIQSIQIKQWKGKEIGRRKDGGIVYDFEPFSYTIIDQNGGELKKEGEFLYFLKTVYFENPNGNTTLFTYWRDLKKPDGTWYTGIHGPDSGIRNQPHPDVIQTILFRQDDPS